MRQGHLAIATIFVLASSFSASAQTCAPGELRVFVLDSQQGPVFDAQAKIGPDNSPLDERMTGTQGVADFKNVPCGAVTVTASKEGFQPAVKVVQMESGANAQVTLTLNPKMQRDSVDVTEAAPPVEQSSSVTTELHPTEVKTLPNNPATVSDALPLVPGVVRTPDGELKIDGTGEQRSGLVVGSPAMSADGGGCSRVSSR